MKRLFRLTATVLFLGGWAFALSAVHVVRTPGQLPVIGSMLPADFGTVHVMTKSSLGFPQTFADTRRWTAGDAASHPIVTERLIACGLPEALPSTTQPVASTPKTQTAAIFTPYGSVVTLPAAHFSPVPTTRPASK